MRWIALDTETTGMNKGRRNGGDVCKGHRVIEIGCVEIVNGNITGKQFHAYIKPDRKVDQKATLIHGITDDFLHDKPVFQQVVKSLLKFIGGSNLIIHNAPFDIAFLDQEFSLLAGVNQPKELFTVTDTLQVARECFPFQNNTLNALGARLDIGLKREGRHGALLDAEMLARVYLKMRGLNLIGGDA